jgi:hypothetical protein
MPQWNIRGAHRETGRDVSVTVTAENVKQAKEQAYAMGVLIAKTRKVREPGAVRPSVKSISTDFGRFSLPVVGEKRYQEAIEEIAGGKTEDGAHCYSRATLALEDENRYDRNAVRVDIDGRTVGYLARDDAVQYRKELRKHGAAKVTLECEAIIVGGWSRGDGDEGHFGVRLDMQLETSS